MQISRAYIDRVRQAAPIVDIIEEHVRLRRSGGEFVGRCPFHEESTPSFYVNGTKGVFLCRGCGASGDAIGFLTDHLGLGFMEALEQLARRSGLPDPSSARERDRGFDEQAGLLDLLERSTRFYEAQLRDSPEALAYLRTRGVDPGAQERFRIGFAPRDYGSLLRHLKGASPEMLKRAGLALDSDRPGGGLRDWAGNRIIFPIRNTQGRVIGFGGRSLDPRNKRKYLNTPETELFHKNSELYGFYEAAPSIRKSDEAVVVEGYLDVVVPASRGVTNVVSAMGTGLSPVGIQKLARCAQTLTLAFDADEAGRRAAWRAINVAAPLLTDRSAVRITTLPEGTDPDEVVIRDGAPALRELFAKSLPLSRYLVEECSRRNDMDSVEGRARFASDAMQIVATFQTPTLRALMAQAVRERLGPGIPLPEIGPSPGASAQNPAGHSTAATAGRPAAAAQSPPPESSIAPGPRAPQARAPSASRANNPSTPVGLATRVMAIILRDPSAAEHFNPDWLALVNTPEADIQGLRVAIAAARHPTGGLAESLRGTEAEDLAARAAALDENALAIDPYEQLTGIIEFLRVHAERAANVRRIRGASAG